MAIEELERAAVDPDEQDAPEKIELDPVSVCRDLDFIYQMLSDQSLELLSLRLQVREVKLVAVVLSVITCMVLLALLVIKRTAF